VIDNYARSGRQRAQSHFGQLASVASVGSSRSQETVALGVALTCGLRNGVRRPDSNATERFEFDNRQCVATGSAFGHFLGDPQCKFGPFLVGMYIEGAAMRLRDLGSNIETEPQAHPIRMVCAANKRIE
jgi:hypothetical protein